MRLDLPTIAHYARHAGYVGADVTTATAIAWVGSGGHTDLDLSLNSPGAGRYVGLWALDITEWPDYAAAELLHPTRAAEVAYELSRRVDGFSWSPVFRAGAERAYLERARLAESHHPHAERIPAPIASQVLGKHADRVLDRLRSPRPTR